MLVDAIFSIRNSTDFERVALEVFHFQYRNNPVYHKFCKLLKISESQVSAVKEIPYMPIEFFKSFEVVTTKASPEAIFTSSGTTGSQVSSHHVASLSIYESSFRKGFDHFYGDIRQYTILALLPSYLERQGSSLVYMADTLIKDSQQKDSGFYLDDMDRLIATLRRLVTEGKKVLLLGVSFALLDLAEYNSLQLGDAVIVMETGGMKGRKKEMIRAHLHGLLQQGLGVSRIHSEYGMTELLAQAYSKGDGVFACPPWMKITIRDPKDPLSMLPNGKVGGLNCIDLTNLHSCSFIATQDLGKTHPDGGFEVLGRFDDSDLRGCNLMVV